MRARPLGPLALACALSCAAMLARPSAARACASAPPPGEMVHTHREDALIVWDEAQHLEHFVRSAVFDTAARSFGFLVPTPARPALAEANDAVMRALAEITKPEDVHETRYEPVAFGCTAMTLMRGATKSAQVEAAASHDAVRVLEETRVAGLDATVLAADDAEALSKWLEARGFEQRDALKRWLSPYVAKKWVITAFRYARPDVAANAPVFVEPIASRAVRMTFTTDAPIYPYREPDDVTSPSDRELRLFVVSPARAEGALPELGADSAWPAPLRFAGPTGDAPALAAALPGVTLPRGAWVSEFGDVATVRPASDLVFRPAASRAPVRPPRNVIVDRVEVPVPYEVPFLVGAIWWWRRRSRNIRAAQR